MTLLDSIRCGGDTRRGADVLCKNCGYDPEIIGRQILEACGFEVRGFLEGDVSVKNSKGKILFTRSYPHYDM